MQPGYHAANVAYIDFECGRFQPASDPDAWPLLLQDFEYTGDCFADVVLEFLDRFTLRIASRQGGNLSPKADGARLP
jgi:hypothetical protein